jgi:hypothetical protein
VNVCVQWGDEKSCKILVGTPRRKWEVMEVERERVDWMQLAQDRNEWRALVSTVIDEI